MYKTILQVVQHLKPGGIETMALDLQRYLPNCHVHIVSLEGSETEMLTRWPRLKNRRTHLHFLNKKPGFHLSTLMKLIWLMKKLKVDAVHTHHIGPLTYGGTAARLCSIQNLVHTEHDAWHLENPKSRHLEQQLIRILKPCLVADCALVAEKLQGFFNNVMPYVIFNGIDTQRFAPQTSMDKATARKHLGLPETVPLIGCAARLEEVKGISYLIAAISHLPPNTHLVIAGQGPQMERLVRQASFNNAKDRIFFLGPVEDMPLFYKALDLFCLPSLNEGFPLSPLEAQACDIPTVLTDVGGAKETLCPKTGTLVPASNVHALAQALKNNLENPSKISPRLFVQERADIRMMCLAYAKLLAI